MEIKDIKGEKFGRLTAVERAGKQGRHVLWRFKCECGNEIILPDMTFAQWEKSKRGEGYLQK